MVKINDSKCVDGPQIAVILKRIERIKNEAMEKERKKNGLRKVME